MPASLSAVPTLSLKDVTEGLTSNWTSIAAQPRYVPAARCFRWLPIEPAIYPLASYDLTVDVAESSTITRPFPANPADIAQTSRFALGASAWVKAFPAFAPSVKLVIEPQAQFEFHAQGCRFN